MRFDAIELRPARVAAVVVGVLVLAGLLLHPVEEPAWKEVRGRQPALRLESIEGALGQGVTVGLLGGFRAIVADFFWLRGNVVWERKDLPATQTMIKLVTAIDPRPLYFWLNGARIIAYDLPKWRIDAAGGYEQVSAEQRQQITLAQADLALQMLEHARSHHPASAAVWIEIANVHLNRRNDPVAAAEAYRRAAAQPDAPYYAARIYAELLRRIGRPREAYDWLVHLYPTLPKVPAPGRVTPEQVDAAMADVVLARIRALERELGIPAEQRVRP